MAKTENRWFQIIAAIVISAILIWALVPRQWLYVGGGIAATIIGLISYRTIKDKGKQQFLKALKDIGKRFYKWLSGSDATSKGKILDTLPAHDFAKLRNAVGNRCESPHCPNSSVVTLVPHHIIPRRKEGSSHKLRNLLVLCEHCHRLAGRGVPNDYTQKEWARNKRGRFKYPLYKSWRYGY